MQKGAESNTLYNQKEQYPDWSTKKTGLQFKKEN